VTSDTEASPPEKMETRHGISSKWRGEAVRALKVLTKEGDILVKMSPFSGACSATTLKLENKNPANTHDGFMNPAL
jgi:hypothetical protein